MDQTVNLDGFTERKNSNKGPAHTSSHDRLPSSDEVKACRKGLRSSWGPSTPAGRDARATVATTLMHHGSRLLDLNVPTTSIQGQLLAHSSNGSVLTLAADRSTLNSRKQDKRPADDSTSSSSSKKPRQSFEGAAPSKTAASKIAAHSNTASSKRTVASKIAEDRNEEIANNGEGQGISDSRFEAILFEEIYESHVGLPDEMRLRHTIFCIQCLRKKSAHSEARDLKACMAVAGDINAPHGTYDSLWAIYLHWPSKRPPPVKGSKSKCPPQNPFETILDKGNASINFVLNCSPT